MDITEIKFFEERRPRAGEDRLLAYVTVTFDGCFVVRELRLIRGDSGPFLSMPYRKLVDPCPACHRKNPVTARFCGECGGKLAENRAGRDDRGRPKIHVDVCHPVDQETRRRLTAAVAAAWDTFRLAKETRDVDGGVPAL